MDPENRSHRVTIAQIAKAAGVSPSTVSYALGDHGPCSAETRQRVRKVADALGYRRDPALDALVSYRGSRRRSRQGYNIGFIHTPPDDGMTRYSRLVLSGIQERAEELGFAIDILRTQDICQAPRNGARILASRGISSLIVTPMMDADFVRAFPWSDFHVVSIARRTRSLPFERIVADHYAASRLVYRQVREAGYRRIGLALELIYSQLVEHLFLASYLAESTTYPDASLIPPLLTDDPSREELEAWLEQHRPEVVIGRSKRMMEVAYKLNLSVPGDFAYASLNANLENDGEGVAGVRQPYHRIGRTAVDQLNRRIHSNLRGPCEHNEITLLSGVWEAGRSLPERA